MVIKGETESDIRSIMTLFRKQLDIFLRINAIMHVHGSIGRNVCLFINHRRNEFPVENVSGYFCDHILIMWLTHFPTFCKFP